MRLCKGLDSWGARGRRLVGDSAAGGLAPDDGGDDDEDDDRDCVDSGVGVFGVIEVTFS